MFFVASPARRRPWRRLIRAARRRPAHGLGWTLTALIRRLSGSDLVHVAISYGGAVLNVTYNHGNQFWPLLAYATTYPRLYCVFEVPLSWSIDLDAYPAGDRKRIFPTFARWLTRGRVQTADCMAITCDLLRAGGVDVPRHVVTPAQLHAWLTNQGFKSVRLDGSDSAHHRGADPVDGIAA